MALGMQAQISGPLFDGRARKAAQQMTEEARDEVALRYGIDVVQRLHEVVKHPTPYYWTRIDVVKEGPVAVVTDHGIVYGPWLAGVGSRNYPRTRFRGYDHWRRASQRVRSRWRELSVKLLNKYVPRMNG